MLSSQMYASSGRFKAKHVTIDGHVFDSKLEGRRYSQLKLMQAGGKISHLRPHPELKLKVNGTDCGTYTPDFGYMEAGNVVIEEVKGFVLPNDFKRFWRIVRALYPNYEFRLMRGKGSNYKELRVK